MDIKIVFDKLKSDDSKISRITRIILYVLVSLLFFSIWPEIISFTMLNQYSSLLLVLIIVSLPFYLLYTILKYKNPTSYLIVIMMLYFTTINELSSLANLVHPYLERQKEIEKGGLLALISKYSFCIPCEIKSSLKLICLSIIAILIMNSQFLDRRFRWKSNRHFKFMKLAVLVFAGSVIYRHFV